MESRGMRPPDVKLETAKDLSLCYGCGKNNPIGLQMAFTWDGTSARAEFLPTRYHQGWPGIVHGGIICTLLDEAMGYVTWFLGLHCVTAKFEMRIRMTTPIDEKLLVSASVVQKTRRLMRIGAAVSLADGRPVAEGTGLMYVTK